MAQFFWISTAAMASATAGLRSLESVSGVGRVFNNLTNAHRGIILFAWKKLSPWGGGFLCVLQFGEGGIVHFGIFF